MQRNKASPRDEDRESGGKLASIPAVSRLLDTPVVGRLTRRYGRRLVRDLLRTRLETMRGQVREGRLAGDELGRAVRPSTIAREVERAARELLAPAPHEVINATGVVVHTNLGRSVLSPPAAERVAAVARSYIDLEYDLHRGGRGNRSDHLAPLMSHLFPDYGFLVVNNNAAAIMLALRALARGREVIVSRGELVEIGGSFRVPDILAASGARLREVGTTNRTRLSDYESAVNPKTGVLLKVHTSNFRIVGFTEETSIGSLAELARRVERPLVVDWGSGDLIDLAPLGLDDEVPALEVLRAGADLVTFSGDKLLGGPQAGFVVGRRELIARVRRDPLARVTRLDRLMIAAMHETLSAYVRGKAMEEVPTLRMLAATVDEIGRRARRVKREVGRRTGLARRMKVIDGVSRTGGGTSPTGERATALLAVESGAKDAAPLERALRGGRPPVIGRVQRGVVLLDLRTVFEEQDALLTERLVAALDAEGVKR